MRHQTYTLFLFLSLFSVVFFASCLKDEVEINRITYTDQEFATLQRSLNLPREVATYDISFPPHVQRLAATSVRKINGNKATLGRVLFYDKQLSKTQTVSCASCHLQEKAFADKDALSTGFDGRLTKRNSLSLGVSISTYDNSGSLFFWDDRAHSVEQQSKMTIEDPIEMGMSLKDLTARLQGIDYYNILFQKAYGVQGITENNIVNAISEFINSITSFDTPFDEGMSRPVLSTTGELATLSAEENFGRSIFMANCSSCHGNTLGGAQGFLNTANNGLDISYEDNGLGALTQNRLHMGLFKVPLLRNVELTAPYMHDGRFATLEEVVEHYSTGIQPHENLHPFLKEENGQPKRFNFSQEEKNALIAFLRTLTDHSMIKEEKFSNPFK